MKSVSAAEAYIFIDKHELTSYDTYHNTMTKGNFIEYLDSSGVCQAEIFVDGFGGPYLINQ